MKLTTKQLTLCALLTAMALALSYLENLFPPVSYTHLRAHET